MKLSSIYINNYFHTFFLLISSCSHGLLVFVVTELLDLAALQRFHENRQKHNPIFVSGTIIWGTLKAPNSQLVTPISTKLQRPDGRD
jgi:hypothetical protein